MSVDESSLTFVSDVYDYILIISALSAISCYSGMDKASKIICMLIWCGIVTESIAWVAVVKYKNNMPVYAVASIAEFIIICLYYNSSLHYYKQRHIGWIVAAVGGAFGIMNMVIFQPLHMVNSNFLFFECLGIVCLSLFAIYQRLMATDLRLLKETHFWIPCILLGYKCSTLWTWGFYDYLLARVSEKMIYLHIGLLLVNILTYLSLMILLMLYPKMRRTHV
jgi:hypothetical protein